MYEFGGDAIQYIALFNGERIMFSINSMGTIGCPQAKKKMNLDIDLTLFININSKYKM